MTIGEFLSARLDEDEAAANAASIAPVESRYKSGADLGPAVARLLFHRHFDPERVLAEVTAKRKMLGVHRVNRKGQCRICARWTTDTDADGYRLDHVAYEGEADPCLTRRLMALPYADHPDYDPAWRVQ